LIAAQPGASASLADARLLAPFFRQHPLALDARRLEFGGIAEGVQIVEPSALPSYPTVFL
jgi:hypothetical protein